MDNGTTSAMPADYDLPLASAPAADQPSPLPVVERGVNQRIDPRSVTLGRVARWPMASLLGGAAIVSACAGALAAGGHPLVWATALPVSALLCGLLAVYAHVGPRWRYEHTTYRVDAHGIEIRQGRFWRRVTTVPRSRVQHTDVAQGPLERRLGLATLIVYTAGTEHSAIPLAGLAHETALALRHNLLGEEGGDAV
ncbi:MAG TPA: PH domain-containing protein [Vicinamibacterales bacterium]